VYSLGVVLYELLTGQRPYRLQRAAKQEMARVIAEDEPARPSQVVDRQISEGLAGDLDSILLMALRKEPEQRYSSAESFADDLKRHLEQRPIQAREATPWERFMRFRRRNPGGFVAGATVGTSFIAGLVAVGWQARNGLQAAALDSGTKLFFAPFWLFFCGFGVSTVCAVAYFSKARKSLQWGAAVGGLFLGLGMVGRARFENRLGWWSSRVPGQEDPLMLFSPLSFLAASLVGAALLLLLSVVGRRFGWRGQTASLVVLASCQVVRERIRFGELIPGLSFQPGVFPMVSGAGTVVAFGAVALLVMNLIAGREHK